MQNKDDHRPAHRPDYLHYFLLVAIAGFFLARLPLLPHRLFDPDEFQHSHAAWCVFKGMVPYRDFFEHHTPWYYYTLSPFFRGFNVEGSYESARHFLIFARGLSLVLTVVSVVLVVFVGQLLANRTVGLVAGLMLVGQPVFFQKTIEIRPDILALPFYLGGLWFLLRGLERTTTAAKSLRAFLFGGLGLGAAIMCTQKMLFVLPGTLAAMGLWFLLGGRARDGAGPRTRVARTLAFGLGGAIPIMCTWALFALQHAGGLFIANNFLVNAKWNYVVHEQLLLFLETTWTVLLLALLAATVAVYRWIRSEERRYGEILLLCTLAGLIAGILIVPVAHRQYYLMALPILCLFAAKGLGVLLDFAKERARSRLLVLALVPLSVLPALGLHDAFSSRNDQQLARLRQVIETTSATDVVMDGWEGTGVFRPHAFHHYFLHDEALAMIPRVQVDALLDNLESGRLRPKLIALDDQLVALGSRFLKFIKVNYESRDGFFYYLKNGTPAPVNRPASVRSE